MNSILLFPCHEMIRVTVFKTMLCFIGLRPQWHACVMCAFNNSGWLLPGTIPYSGPIAGAASISKKAWTTRAKTAIRTTLPACHPNLDNGPMSSRVLSRLGVSCRYLFHHIDGEHPSKVCFTKFTTNLQVSNSSRPFSILMHRSNVLSEDSTWIFA